MKKQSGIYEILNTADGKRYVGQAVNIARRWGDHRKNLRAGRHSRHRHLQSAWNKHGEPAFVFSVLELCAPEKEALRACEQKWMDLLGPEYNTEPAAGSSLGVKRPEQTVRQTGKKLSAEWCANISEGKRGKKLGPHSPEWNEKIAAGNRGKVVSLSTREKQAAAKLGTHQSAEHIVKRSKHLPGNSYALGAVHTVEMRAAKSQRQRGTPQLHYARRMPLGIAYG